MHCWSRVALWTLQVRFFNWHLVNRCHKSSVRTKLIRSYHQNIHTSIMMHRHPRRQTLFRFNVYTLSKHELYDLTSLSKPSLTNVKTAQSAWTNHIQIHVEVVKFQIFVAGPTIFDAMLLTLRTSTSDDKSFAKTYLCFAQFKGARNPVLFKESQTDVRCLSAMQLSNIKTTRITTLHWISKLD